MIQHPQKARMLFNLYPFQEKVLKLFQNNLFFSSRERYAMSFLVHVYLVQINLQERKNFKYKSKSWRQSMG
jgi:hypothetical protein